MHLPAITHTRVLMLLAPLVLSRSWAPCVTRPTLGVREAALVRSPSPTYASPNPLTSVRTISVQHPPAMDVALSYMKARRSLTRHASTASSGAGQADLRAFAVSEDDQHSPEGFCLTESEEAAPGACAGSEAPGACAGSEAPGTCARSAAPGACAGSEAPAVPDEIIAGDWLMFNDRVVEVKEVVKVLDKKLYECIHIPEMKGLSGLPVAVQADTAHLRKLTKQETEDLRAKMSSEPAKRGRGRGRCGRGSRGSHGSRGRGSCGRGEAPGPDEQGRAVPRPDEGGLAAPGALSGAPGTPTPTDLPKEGLQSASSAAPGTPTASNAAPGTPTSKHASKQGIVASPPVQGYKTAESAGRAAYRRVLTRGGTKQLAQQRNREVMSEWRAHKQQKTDSGPGVQPLASSGSSKSDRQLFFRRRLAELKEEHGNAKGDGKGLNRMLFAQVAREHADHRLAKQRAEAGKAAAAEAVLKRPSMSQPLLNDPLATAETVEQNVAGQPLATAGTQPAVEQDDATQPLASAETQPAVEKDVCAQFLASLPGKSQARASDDSPNSGRKPHPRSTPGPKLSRRKWRLQPVDPVADPLAAPGASVADASGSPASGPAALGADGTDTMQSMGMGSMPSDMKEESGADEEEEELGMDLDEVMRED